MSGFMEHIQHTYDEAQADQPPLEPWEFVLLYGKEPVPEFPVVVFTHPTEWIDRNLATASWWDKYMIQPGVYELEPVTIDYRPCSNATAYYYRVRMDAIRVESYRVSRLFTASTFEHKTDLDEKTTITASSYWYSLWDSVKFPSLKAPTGIRGGHVLYPAGWADQRRSNS